MTIAILGVDLGKNICSVVGLDGTGAVILRRRMRRQTLLGLAADLPACVVAMEACCGANHLGRIFCGHGQDQGRLTFRDRAGVPLVCAALERLHEDAGVRSADLRHLELNRDGLSLTMGFLTS